MSFRWKGLLGVGGNTTSTSTPTSLSISNNLKEHFDEREWANHSFDPLDVPNVLGMENFGNTCYMNSVMQALYFCDPFRESVLSYTSIPQTPTLKNTNEQPKTIITEDESLFSALRMLFQSMASARIENALTGNNNQTESQSQSNQQSSSFIGSGLSRKVSSRPGTANSKYGSTNPSSSTSSTTNNPSSNSNSTNNNVNQTSTSAGGIGSSNGTTSITTAQGNSCSNIVVSDSDIKTFLSSLKKNNILFDSTAHQDAHELLNFVLNRIGEDIVDETKSNQPQQQPQQQQQQQQQQFNPIHNVGPDGKTMVHKLFEGILTNETRCLTCESITSRDESFLDLSLDIERNSSVTSCLRQFSASEMLSSRNKFFCDTCSGLQEAEKRMKIKKLPNVLALHLKRFKYEESVQRFVKLAYRVVFPMQLRLFNTSDDAEDPDKLYELYGIIVHIGIGPHHGHYIAIIKIDKRWFVFDDETISVIDESDISRYFGDTPGAGSAYVLFYQAVELDMQSLGLPNVKAMRAEKARLRREESVKKRIQMYSSHMQNNGGGNIGTNMQRSSSSNATSSSLFSLGSLGIPLNSASPSSNTGDLTPMETPSRTVTPGLFGRLNGGPNANTNLLPTSPSTTTEQNENKSSSWLTSLRSRKPSSNIPIPSIPLSNSPTMMSKKQLYPEHGEDEEGERQSTSSTNLPEDQLVTPTKSTSRQRSPIRGEQWIDGQPSERLINSSSPRRATLSVFPTTNSTTPTTNISPTKSPIRQAAPGQGAIFMPADRPLSKKEQEKIAKTAKRNTTNISISSAHNQLPSPLTPPSTSIPLQVDPIPAAAVDDSQNSETPLISGWRKVTAMPRRPTTADASIDPSAPTSTAQRRRSTLSRTFGFGKKDKSNS